MASDLVFYTAAEVADMLRLHHQVVQRKLQAGEIPGYRIGREWRVERSQLLDWLERYSNQRERPLTDRWFDKDGRLRALPSQRAKRNAVLARVIELIDRDVELTEAQLNAVLRTIFDDVAFLRRELVAEGLMTRQAGIYRRSNGDRRRALKLRGAAPRSG